MLIIRSVGDKVLATVKFATSSRTRVNARLFAFLARSLRTLPPEIVGIQLDRVTGKGGFATLVLVGNVQLSPGQTRDVLNMLRTWPTGLLSIDLDAGVFRPFNTAATALVTLDGVSTAEPDSWPDFSALRVRAIGAHPVLSHENGPHLAAINARGALNDRQSGIGATADERESRFGTA